MTNPTPAPADAVSVADPIGADTVPVNVLKDGVPTRIQGRLIAPGLAITPSMGNKPHRPTRYVLTHTPSGLTTGPGRCAAHIQEAAEQATGFGIDWTADKAAVVEEVKTAGVANVLGARRCSDWCDGDGPKPKTWAVRCNTCDWVYEDEDDEGPLDARQAKEMARDHECEPHVELAAPDSDTWVDPFLVNDDGTIRELPPFGRKVVTVGLPEAGVQS